MHQHSQPHTAVLGFGNPVRSDDGLGCYVLRQLIARHGPRTEAVQFIDMGTSAFEVLFELQGKTRLVLVDAVVHAGDPPGTMYQVPASEIEASHEDDPLVFLHGMKWNQALSYARQMMREDFPEDVQVFLVAVDDTRLAEGLSEPVAQAAEQLIQRIETLLWPSYA
jgi:hydrogenase maturation protease